ncbi:MAG TPA: hypothetical protein VGK58_12840 [Lacipirellulaceae bacterium]
MAESTGLRERQPNPEEYEEGADAAIDPGDHGAAPQIRAGARGEPYDEQIP